MSDTQDAFVQMSGEECRHLLATHRPRLGRLAYVEDEYPLVLPMNFEVINDALYFRTAAGSKVMAALRAQQVTFEMDHIDEVWEEGWSVLAFGRLHLVEDEAELADVRRRPLRPWAAGDRPHYLRMDVNALSGRRIV